MKALLSFLSLTALIAGAAILLQSNTANARSTYTYFIGYTASKHACFAAAYPDGYIHDPVTLRCWGWNIR